MRPRATPVGTPWYVVGVIHALESSLNFGRHLHNGDPLTARTVQVPAGRPKTGQPPFTWEASASDALRYQGFDKWKDWSIPGTLFKLEGYNGFGYRDHHADVPSPYLGASRPTTAPGSTSRTASGRRRRSQRSVGLRSSCDGWRRRT